MASRFSAAQSAGLALFSLSMVCGGSACGTSDDDSGARTASGGGQMMGGGTPMGMMQDPPPAATGTTTGSPPVRNTNISFDWPEADLTAGPGACKGGLYEGAFDGNYTSPVTFIGISVPLTGTVSLTLQEQMTGEFFEISNGAVEGFANFTIPYRAEIIGRLNCQTMKLEGGGLVNGSYEVTPGVPNYFDGPVSAHSATCASGEDVSAATRVRSAQRATRRPGCARW